MSVIRWEDPPEYGSPGRKHGPRRTGYWAAVAAELRESPQAWALVLEGEDWNYAGGISGAIKAGRLVAFRPAGHFDSVTRTVGGCRVYARYVGGESP